MNRILFLSIFLLSPALSAMEQETALTPEPTLRVMTYNIRRKGKESSDERQWEKRLPQVKELIDQMKPTIMGLQEATKEQIDDLQKELPHMNQFGEGRGHRFKLFGENEHTPLFYDTSNLELLDHGTFSLDTSQNPISFLRIFKSKGPVPRIATWGKFKDKRNGKEFFVYNTHLDHWYNEVRVPQLGVIKDAIDQASPDPVIVMGDFNDEFSGNIKDALPSFVHAREGAAQKTGPEATRTGWADDELKWIDHILINKPDQFEVRNYTVVEEEKPYSSDHRAVVAELIIK